MSSRSERGERDLVEPGPDHDASGPDGPEQVHVWKRCHACNASPITGPRFECQTCPDGPDNDLCERCYSAHIEGRVKHPMPGSLAALAGLHADRQHQFIRCPGVSRLGCLPWLEVSGGRATASRIPDHFAVRPEFRVGRESFIGSYGFVVAGRPPILLTCLHVLGSLIQEQRIDASANNHAYTGHELPRVVTGVNLYDVFAPHWMAAPLGRALSMLALPNARIKDEEPFSQRDIAAFVVDSAARVSPAPLADRLPGVGEPVWLVVKPEGGQQQRTIAATVVEQTEATFIFRFLDDTAAMPRFTSGAPLVNRAGEVVAINVGFGTFEGRCFGHGNHADSIRRHLALS